MHYEALRSAREIARRFEKIRMHGAGAKRKCVRELLEASQFLIDKDVVTNRLGLAKLPSDKLSIAMDAMLIVRKGPQYMILVKPHLDEDQERFVVCKEFFEVVIDNNNVRRMELLPHIDETLFTFSDNQRGASATAEDTSVWAAMEFLFPYTDRLEILNGGEEVNYEDIAKTYGMPVEWVEFALLKHVMRKCNPDDVEQITVESTPA